MLSQFFPHIGALVYDLDFQRLNIKPFAKCKSISIDKAIMEKTNLGMVVPLNAGWSDIGSWKSLWDISQKNNEGNYINGRVIAEKSKNCYLKSDNKLLVGIGLKDTIIVNTRDATLVVNKRFSQQNKLI